MLRVYRPHQFSRVPKGHGFDAEQLRTDTPNAHLTYTKNGVVTARCSVWWQGTPMVDGKPVGTIGHFYADQSEDAAVVLSASCDLLREIGCTDVLGPMNGNTWRSYRYATGGAERSPFLMEPPPANGRDCYLQQAGFAPVSRYASYLEELEPATGSTQSVSRAAGSGFSIRALDRNRIREELENVYELAILSFCGNPYYTDLPRDAFVEQYLAYRDVLVPELVLLGYQGDTLAAFLFCIPDYLESPANPRTLLFKTVAVLPQYRSMGLGSHLMATARERALQLGYTHAIAALIYQGNRSEKLCRSGSALRQYTLFGRKI